MTASLAVARIGARTQRSRGSIATFELVERFGQIESDVVVTITAALDRRRPGNDEDRIRLQNLYKCAQRAFVPRLTGDVCGGCWIASQRRSVSSTPSEAATASSSSRLTSSPSPTSCPSGSRRCITRVDRRDSFVDSGAPPQPALSRSRRVRPFDPTVRSHTR